MSFVKNNRGFTLIEILVAISLVSIALGSLVIMLGSGFDGIFGAAHKNQAVYNAQDNMERTLAGPYDSDETVKEGYGFELTFPNRGITINTKGTKIESSGTQKNRDSKMTTFVPVSPQGGNQDD